MRKSYLSLFVRTEYVVLALAVFVSFALMSLSPQSTMDTPRVWILTLLGVFGEKIANIESWFHLAEENAQLRQVNADLALKNAQLREAFIENQRLKKMLAFVQQSPLEFVPARVIGISNRGFVTSVVLNAGSERGLRKNMPLVSNNGLVGKLYSVGKKQSLGQLLIDRNFRVSARVQRSRTTGIVRWLHDNILTLEQVPKRSDVKVGDVVVTSGLTPLFPKGLRIAVVTEVSENVSGLFTKIRLRPDVDFSKLEELFVVGRSIETLKPDQS